MNSGRRITIVLADDHQIVRQGLSALIGTHSDLRVVGETGDGLAAVELVEKLHPDILVADIQMPGLIGLEVVRQLQQRSPQTRVVIFSMYATDTYVIEAFRVGAWGYLLKGSDSSELIEAIRAVKAGRRYHCSAIPARLHQALTDDTGATTRAPTDPYDTLTTREREVFQLISEGLSNKEVGERLFISSRTVEIHRANALRKLGLRTHSDMIRYAMSRGLLPPE
jgi:DNA-binding NarL/FixJ family response regulator